MFIFISERGYFCSLHFSSFLFSLDFFPFDVCTFFVGEKDEDEEEISCGHFFSTLLMSHRMWKIHNWKQQYYHTVSCSIENQAAKGKNGKWKKGEEKLSLLESKYINRCPWIFIFLNKSRSVHVKKRQGNSVPKWFIIPSCDSTMKPSSVYAPCWSQVSGFILGNNIACVNNKVIKGRMLWTCLFVYFSFFIAKLRTMTILLPAESFNLRYSLLVYFASKTMSLSSSDSEEKTLENDKYTLCLHLISKAAPPIIS